MESWLTVVKQYHWASPDATIVGQEPALWSKKLLFVAELVFIGEPIEEHTEETPRPSL